MSFGDIDYDALGKAAMNAVVEGDMIRALPVLDDDDELTGILIKWNGNAPEQIGEALRRHLCPTGLPA